MKIATWNVNSIRTRLPRLLTWLQQRQPDIACFQETKVVDEDFPLAEISELGYRCIISGQRTYNGVAIISRSDACDPILSLPDDDVDAPRRVVAATIDGIRIVSAYAPNGSFVGSEKYEYKLQWYRRLRAFLDSSFDPASRVVLCGDFNVAPEDRDVWDPEKWRGKIMFSDDEKEALQNVMNWGFTDALRLHRSEGGLYTWWDYRAGSFHRGYGLRIDHVLLSQSMARSCTAVEIDRNERKGEKPSDHAPVVAFFDDTVLGSAL